MPSTDEDGICTLTPTTTTTAGRPDRDPGHGPAGHRARTPTGRHVDQDEHHRHRHDGWFAGENQPRRHRRFGPTCGHRAALPEGPTFAVARPVQASPAAGQGHHLHRVANKGGRHQHQHEFVLAFADHDEDGQPDEDITEVGPIQATDDDDDGYADTMEVRRNLYDRPRCRRRRRVRR